MKAYMCVVCGGVYEEEQGNAQSHIPLKTRWEDLLKTWWKWTAPE